VFDVAGDRNIGGKRRSLAAGLMDRFDDRQSFLIPLAIVHRDGSAGFGKRESNGLAHAARAAGHQCDAVLQIGHTVDL